MLPSAALSQEAPVHRLGHADVRHRRRAGHGQEDQHRPGGPRLRRGPLRQPLQGGRHARRGNQARIKHDFGYLHDTAQLVD